MTGCDAVRQQLGAYLDGELLGAERLRVSRHLGKCGTCTREVAAVGQLGVLLRDAVDTEPSVRGLDGLASGVITRVRAEAAQSWRTKVRRAVDDCRLLLASTGSIVGSMATAGFVAAVLMFGPAPEREDSLSAMLNNMSSPAGIIFLVGSAGNLGDDFLMFLPGRSGPPPWVAAQRAVFAAPTSAELAMAYSDVVAPDGKFLELAAMPISDRHDAEALMHAMRQRRSWQAAPLRGGPLTISQVRLVTSTGVTVKGL